MKYFTTSDTHYGHGNIIQYCSRPFSTSNDMNARMIKNFNERVKAEDTTFILGDFCFKSGENCAKAPFWLNQLNGNKIIVRGNHDNNNSTKTIIDCIHVTYANKRINMVHKPEHANPEFEINLVGHVHNKWHIRTFAQHYKAITDAVLALPSDKEDWTKFLETHYQNRNSESILLNVGVDVNRFYPISLDEAIGQTIRFKKGI